MPSPLEVIDVASCHHSTLLEEELLSWPCPQESEGRAWGQQTVLKSKRMEWCQGILRACPPPPPLLALSLSDKREATEARQKTGGRKRAPLPALAALAVNLPHMTDAYGFRQ